MLSFPVYEYTSFTCIYALQSQLHVIVGLVNMSDFSFFFSVVLVSSGQTLQSLHAHCSHKLECGFIWIAQPEINFDQINHPVCLYICQPL